MTTKKETILISACLTGVNCRYDGKSSLNTTLLEELKDCNLIPICPEELGGLPTPRPKAQIKKSGELLEVINEDGINVTEFFLKGAEEVLIIAEEGEVSKAILKENSPSCGVHFIKEGNKKVKGSGITTKLLIENNIKVIGA